MKVYCRFSYAGTWELVNLFVGTKNFNDRICDKNIDSKNSKILKSLETETGLTFTDAAEQYVSQEECIK